MIVYVSLRIMILVWWIIAQWSVSVAQSIWMALVFVSESSQIDKHILFLSGWCDSTCPGFCEGQNDSYQCNCTKYPGYQNSADGRTCVGKIDHWWFDKLIIFISKACGSLNYGYGCTETCECVRGTCNSNATNQNQSCICDSGYHGILCGRILDSCGKNLHSFDPSWLLLWK